MTCVVGVRTESGVILAGDSQGSSTWSNRKYASSKTYQLSDVIAMAYCGSGRLGQILQFHMEHLEDPPLGRDEERWAIRDFIPFVRDVTEAHGHLHIHRNVEELGPSAFLLAVRGRLFSVESDLCVGESLYPYEALGSGEDVAIGSFHSEYGPVEGPLQCSDDEALSSAEDAINAAAEFTNFVGGPITYAQTRLFTDEELEFARSITKPRK